MEQSISLLELSQAIQFELNQSFPDHYWITAEIGECKTNYSGHCYLDLIEKDEQQTKARVRATIWSSNFRALNGYFHTTTGQVIQAGIKVLIKVEVNFHAVYGLSLNVVDIDPTYTLGDIEKKRQEIIDKLKDEGVFDMNKALDEPELIKRIAVVSSETAAGYEDFVDQLLGNEYGFHFDIKLFPAVMQGDQAEASIVQAIERVFIEVDNFDALVLIRGGGAKNDLACFDGYWIAYHMAQFPLPIYTGIGHEQDTSIADMVAFKALKTPTAVAEYFVSGMTQKLANLQECEHQFNQLSNQIITVNKFQLDKLASAFKSESMELLAAHRQLLALSNQKLMHSSEELMDDAKNNVDRMAHQLNLKSSMLYQRQAEQLRRYSGELKMFTLKRIEAAEQTLKFNEKQSRLLDPSNVLKRGFSITQLNGKTIKNKKDVPDGALLETKFHDGILKSRVTKKD